MGVAAQINGRKDRRQAVAKSIVLLADVTHQCKTDVHGLEMQLQVLDLGAQSMPPSRSMAYTSETANIRPVARR